MYHVGVVNIAMIIKWQGKVQLFPYKSSSIIDHSVLKDRILEFYNFWCSAAIWLFLH